MNNSLSISASGTDLVITEAAEAFTAAPSGGTLSNGDKTLTIPLASVTGVLEIRGGGNDDQLTIDLSGGSPFPPGGIQYDGEVNGAGGDKLVIGGGSTTTVTHNFTNANDGSVVLAGAIAGTVNYTGLEPVTDNLSATDRVFTFNGGTETITLTDNLAADGMMRIDSTLGELVDFTNPTNSLTINGGSGDDSIVIDSRDSGAAVASLTVNGDAGTDNVQFGPNLPLSPAVIQFKSLTSNTETVSTLPVLTVNPGNLSITATGAGSSLTVGGQISATGTVTLDSNTITYLAAPIYTSGSAVAINDDVRLTANVLIDTTGAGAFPTGGNITITGATNADSAANNRNLTLTAGTGGAISLQNVGATANLNMFTITGAASANLQQVRTRSGGISISAAAITLNNTLSSDALVTGGPITLIGNVTMAAPILIDTNGTTTGGVVSISGGTVTNAGNLLTVDIGPSATGIITSFVNGTGGLTKLGGGTLVLNPSGSNGYTGLTTVNAGILGVAGSAGDGTIRGNITVNSGGTLRLDVSNRIINSSVVTINLGGTLNTNGQGEALGALVGAGAISGGGSGLTLDTPSAAGAATFSGTITGVTVGVRGELVDGGSSRQVLTGTSTGMGTIAVSRGNSANDASVLEFGGAGSTTAGGLTLGVGGSGSATALITGTHAVTLGFVSGGEGTGHPGTLTQSGGSLTVSGQFRFGHYPSETSTYNLSAGTLSLTGTASTEEGAGTLTIGVDGTGVVNISGGTATVQRVHMDARAATGGVDQLNMTGGVLEVRGGGITGNADTTTYAVNLGGATIRSLASFTMSTPATLTGTNGSLTFDTNGAGNTITSTGVLSGAGGLNKINAGTLNLTAQETYTGNTSITGGVFQVNTGRIYSNNAWANRSISISGGAVAEVGGWADGDGTGFGQVAFAAGNIVVNNGTIKYTGATTTGNADRGFTIGAGGTTLQAEGTNDFTLNQGRGFGVTSAAGGTLTLTGSKNGVWNMNLGGTGGMTKTGSGTWNVTGNNTYSGNTRILGGTMTVSGTGTIKGTNYVGNNQSSTTSVLNVQGNALIQTVGTAGYMVFGDQSNAAITINQSGGTVTNAGTTNNPAGNNLANRWGHWGGGTTNYNLSGGTLNLTGAPLYLSWDGAATLNITGGVANIKGFNMGYNGRNNASTINVGGTGRLNVGSDGIITGGTLNKTINLAGGTVGAFANWSSSMNMNVTATSTINTLDSVDNATARTITLGGVLSGAGGLTKDGEGTLRLTNANTFGGGATINAGTLSAENSTGSATGSGLVTVNTGGKLAGNGIVGDVTLNSGGFLSAGLSGGDNVLGTLNTAALNLASDAIFKFDLNTTSLASDLVNVSGNLGLGSASILTLTDLGADTPIHNNTFTMIDYSGSWTGGQFSVMGLPIADEGVFAYGSNWFRLDYDEGTSAVLEVFAGELKVTDLTGAVELSDAQVAKVNYGGTLIGSPVVRNYQIENVGSQGNLFVDQITVPAGYTLTAPAVAPTPAAPVILTPGQTLNFTAQLSAAAAGEFAGDVSITTNDEDEGTFTFPVTGFVIDLTPASQSVDASLAATFTSTSLPVGYTYSWDHDGNPLPTTTNSHTVDPVRLNSAGTYTITVTSPLGSVITDNGVLTVTVPAPDGSITSEGTNPIGVSGAQFASLRSGPKINEPGRIIFRGWLLQGSGVTPVTAADDTGIWFQDGLGGLNLLAREGSASDGIADIYGSINYNPAWTDGDNYAFSAYLITNHSGIWTGTAGSSPVLELAGGDLVPGLGGPVVASLATPVMQNNAGILAAKLIMKTSVGGVTGFTDGSILYGTSGSLNVIAREGSPAAGTDGKFTGLMSSDWISMDESGQLLYQGVLASQTTPSVINSTNNNGLWLYDGSATSLVARGGAPAADLAAGILYYIPRWAVIAGGRVAFQSSLRGAGITAGVNDLAIFVGNPGSLSTVARIGVTSGIGSPAGVSGAAFGKLGYPRIARSPDNEVAFRAELKSGIAGVALANNEGIWKEKNGVVSLLAREGDASPIGGGVNFGAMGEPFPGENGQVLFSAKLTGTGVSATNDSALFCEQSDGALRLLLREGDVLSTDGGLRTVADLLSNYVYPEEVRVLNFNGVAALQVPYSSGYTGLVRMVAP